MKRLIVHVGTHKTGTTSIQYTLARSDQALAQQGAIYPAHYDNPNNPGHHFLAIGGSGKRYNALIEDIDRAAQETVILSTELLSVTSPETIADLASRYDTRIICLLRRQDDYLESMYRELCKSSFCDLTPDAFVETVLAGDPLLIFSNFKETEIRATLPADYEKLLEDYAKLLGEDRVTAIPYDDPAFGADALEKFSNATGLTLKAVGGGPRNVSFSPEIVQLRGMIDRDLPNQEKLALRHAFWKLNDTVALEQKGLSVLNQEQRRLILDHYAVSNAKLHKRFIPKAGVKWLTAPYEASEAINAEQAPSLNVERAVELTSRLMTLAGKPPPQAPAKPVAKAPVKRPAKPYIALQKPPERRKAPPDMSGQIDLVGLCFANVELLLTDPERLRSYLDAIDECSLNAIRIPFYWRRLIVYEADGSLQINQQLADAYLDLFNLLPKTMNITGVVVNCHPEVARMAYLGQPGFAERYAEYVGLLVETFPFIDDIELWNEPNASDFYVSVKGEHGDHRPWSGSEFVEMVIRPGVESLRRSGFSGRICGVTFAENGLVGHTNRSRPAFANTMRSYASEFATEFEDNKSHGAFYFQPDFSRDVMWALKAYYTSAQDLPFEAFGIHPYPYFGSAPDGFAQHSWKLTQEFLKLLDEAGYAGMPIWVTEVGARSLDLSNAYDFNAIEQANFVDDFMSNAASEPSIEKLFWYKYRDEAWDLKQEKTFGLFDHAGRKKPAYYSFRNWTLRCLPRESIQTLQDDFSFGAVMQASSVDSSFWSIEKTEPFAYAIPACTESYNDFALLSSPGRKLDSVLRLQTKLHLAADKSQQLKASIRFRPKSEGKGKAIMRLGLEVTNLANPKTGLFLAARVNSANGVLAFDFGTTREKQTQVAEMCLSNLTRFVELVLETRDGRVWLCCKEVDGSILTEVDLCAASQAHLGRRLRGAIEASRVKGDIHFIEISKFIMRRPD